MVVTVVSITGRRRLMPASIRAWRTRMPRRRAWLAKSTSTIASLTTMPARATSPMNEARLNGSPQTSMPKTTPTKLSGTVNSTTSAWRKLLNWITRIAQMSITPTIITRFR